MNLWQCLAEELDRWSDTAETATFWWRDDDAVTTTPQLEVLLKYAHSTPLCLSVIPNSFRPELVDRLTDARSVVILQHGWAHKNYATVGKSEYPPSRSDDQVAQELSAGRQLLKDRFGNRALPVFVPPWHSFGDRFLPLLPQNGIEHISRKGPRTALLAGMGLRQVNAHVAPITWTVPPSFIDDADPLATILDHLQGRRRQQYDPLEPTGLLTHHLVQNQRSYDFISRFLDVTSHSAAGRWLGGGDVFKISRGSQWSAPPAPD